MPSTENDQERRVGGRYRLSSELGSGAMGTVWSGYDDVLQLRRWLGLLEGPIDLAYTTTLQPRGRLQKIRR